MILYIFSTFVRGMSTMVRGQISLGSRPNCRHQFFSFLGRIAFPMISRLLPTFFVYSLWGLHPSIFQGFSLAFPVLLGWKWHWGLSSSSWLSVMSSCDITLQLKVPYTSVLECSEIWNFFASECAFIIQYSPAYKWKSMERKVKV